MLLTAVSYIITSAVTDEHARQNCNATPKTSDLFKVHVMEACPALLNVRKCSVSSINGLTIIGCGNVIMHNIPYRSQLAPAATADEEQVQEELEHAEPADGPDGAGAGAPPGAGAP